MGRITLREFDLPCPPPFEPLQREEIKRIHEASQASRAVFVALLNTSA